MDIVDRIKQHRADLDVPIADIDPVFTVTPGELYTLCTALQQGEEIRGSRYRQLMNCIDAMIHRSWEVAVAAMPASAYGVKLKLRIPRLE